MAYSGIGLDITSNNIPDLTIGYARWGATKDVLLCIAHPCHIPKGKHPLNYFIAIHS
jgi:hypothetical protein